MRFAKKYQYKPKLVDEIIVRKFDFDFPDRLNPEWIPNSPVRSYFLERDLSYHALFGAIFSQNQP